MYMDGAIHTDSHGHGHRSETRTMGARAPWVLVSGVPPGCGSSPAKRAPPAEQQRMQHTRRACTRFLVWSRSTTPEAASGIWLLADPGLPCPPWPVLERI